MNTRRLIVAATLGIGTIAALTLIWLPDGRITMVTAAPESSQRLRVPGDAGAAVAIQVSDTITTFDHLRLWSDAAYVPPIRASTTLTPVAYLPVVISRWPPISIVEHNGYRFVYWYRSGSTWIEAYSEVGNYGQQNVEDVEVIFNVYDAGGTLVATDTGYSMVRVIRPGQSSPVAFYLDVPGGYAIIESGRVELTVRNTWSCTSIDTQNSFELISHSGFEDSYGAWHVVGEVRNIRGVTIDLQVAAWIRGWGRFQDMIIAAENDWVWDVTPGEQVPFEVIFWKDFGDSYDHYEIVLEES